MQRGIFLLENSFALCEVLAALMFFALALLLATSGTQAVGDSCAQANSSSAHSTSKCQLLSSARPVLDFYSPSVDKNRLVEELAFEEEDSQDPTDDDCGCAAAGTQTGQLLIRFETHTFSHTEVHHKKQSGFEPGLPRGPPVDRH
jgi:hypothetical protein